MTRVPPSVAGSSTPSSAKGDLYTGFDTVTHDVWKALAEKSLKAGDDLDSLVTNTLDPLSIRALYDSRPPCPAESRKTEPKSPMAGSSSVDNRLQLCATSVAAAREQALSGLAGGNTSLEFDGMATHDLGNVLDGVLLDVAPVALGPHSATTTTATTLQRLWREQYPDNSDLAGALNLDPIGARLRGVSDNDDFAEHLSACTRLAAETLNEWPSVSTMGIDVSVHHAAGASATQELVAAMATANVYVEALLQQGLTINEASAALVFRVSVDSNTLLSLCKLRALRHLWRHIRSHRGAADVPMALVCDTSQRTHARREIWVNHLRNVSACTAAFMGGADTVIVHPHNRIDGAWLDDDHVLGLRMARNLPIMLDSESHFNAISDPMGGSYAVESLTRELVDAAWQILSGQLADSTSWLEQLQTGQWHAQLQATHHARLERLDQQQDVRIGVNRFNDGQLHALPNSAMGSTQHESTSTGHIAALTRVRDAEGMEAQS